MSFYRPIQPATLTVSELVGRKAEEGEEDPAAAIEALSSDLLSAADRFQHDQDAHLLGLSLSRLITLLRLHLARADRVLAASTLAREDAALARLFRARAEEMRCVGDQIERFALRYADAGSAMSDVTGFRHDVNVLVGHLAERVERDRTILPRICAQLSHREAPGC